MGGRLQEGCADLSTRRDHVFAIVQHDEHPGGAQAGADCFGPPNFRGFMNAEHRSDLSDRLDAAVKAGDLTAADKASVLKAFDAGVLDGPH